MNKNSRIIIADPHGSYKTLMALVAQLPTGVPITFAGDLIDRGIGSNKIIKFVRDNGYDCINGNHEVMMINELQFEMESNGEERPFADEREGIWLMNGGDATLYSYRNEEVYSFAGVVKTKTYDIKTLKEDLEWIKSLPYFLEYKDLVNSKGQHLLVTHSTAAEVWGKFPTDSKEFIDYVTWQRKSVPKKIPGIYNVYGHTPQRNKALIRSNFACIDTGAFYKRGDYGKMTALQFPEMKVFTQKNVEDPI